ncbi:DUF2232 domain-containing protein [Chamaesiphon sp. OTE_75_metabat_556]|uniref:DUF2232 domain-containing protein n=1 Tax=Chamaesiphon sp. OTE_75_metabat_556 TaxID=2964692 RepID=UPI00286D14D0|nr:DUF2232 domain-containing protein [Chamaesiphon sp. OTE_75_metabat_556]
MASPIEHQSSAEERAATVDRPPITQPPIVMVETAFLASTTSLLWLLSYYVPGIPIFRVFFPIPIALIYLRWGRRAGWMTTLVSGLLLTVLMGPARSIPFVIPYGLMGVQLGACWRRRTGWGLSIWLGALLGCIGVFFQFWLTSVLVGEDLWAYAIARIRDLVEWLFLQLGILAEPSLPIVQFLVLLALLLSNLVYVFVVHTIALLMFERLGNPIPKAPAWVDTLLDL